MLECDKASLRMLGSRREKAPNIVCRSGNTLQGTAMAETSLEKCEYNLQKKNVLGKENIFQSNYCDLEGTSRGCSGQAERMQYHV